MELTGIAERSGTFELGGDVPVHRLGFGAMRITGKGIWGPPADRDEAIAVLVELQREGKIRHIGLSEVDVEQIERARRHFPVVSVQNQYNLVQRDWEDVLDYCERAGIAFLPWNPLQVGRLAKSGGAVARVAERHQATPAQIALAWLLHRSPVMLPIPGTSKVAHLEENMAAASIQLSDDEFERLA